MMRLILSVLLVGAVIMNPAGVTAEEEGFQSLFDGKSLKGWRGYHQEEVGKGWKAEDGQLVFDGSGGGDIITQDTYSSFDLRFEWKVAEASNSGVMYRVSLGDNAPYFSGPEYQILDDAKHRDGQNPKTSAGSLYALYAPEDKTLAPVGEWNESRIVVQGSRVEHWLNGKKIVQADLQSDDWKKRVAESKFAEWSKFGRVPSGHIAFQDHGDPVWYRNLRIKKLLAKDTSRD